ncbi:carboxylesterase 1-like [Phalaenopsis equestris]|uniref:carboxylesterase 1-like n=1 Tax=Phalaenopsis equestris TaxID=78828 RepID=UPI0009E60DC0|nr:carboxylesterase 1-like [Phalaenopsis equestris]
MMWRLALPPGADRDHEYCNPAAVMDVERISRMRARFLVTCRRGDPLIDRQRQLVKVMEAAGLQVAAQLEEEGFHAMELFDPAAAEVLFATVKEFINA